MPNLSDVLGGVTKLSVQGSLEREVAGLCHDSRQAAPGCLFFALPGQRTDGNRHVLEAVQKGAAAVVSEMRSPPAPLSLPATWVQVQDANEALGAAADRFFGRPSRRLTVVGLTGTNGKTTSSYFLEAVFAAAGKTVGVLGTVEYRVGGRRLGEASHTTPFAPELHGLLRRMADEGASHVVMEVSSHALALRRADEVLFDAAVFTNLTRDHLDFHKTPEAYFEAKRRLFELLERRRQDKPRRLAVWNADDPWSARLEGAAPHAETASFGFSEGAGFRGAAVELGPKGTRFRLERRKGSVPVRLRLVGRHNVLNALAAYAASSGLGVPEARILEGLEALAHVPGRLEPVDEGQDFTVLVDYAHTDGALAAVLENLRALPHRRILTVFGCGGDRDAGKRGPMGRAACTGSDLAFVTSDNPRSEDPDAIIEDILAGLRQGGHRNFKVVKDRAEAIRAAVREAAPGDVVLIAGKGHEDYQLVQGRKLHFDDREAAREALRARKAGAR